METVIVTYADDDSNFADRLILDLSESQVPATYDKWLLGGGDSIIEKIAQTEVASDGVIALVSPNSVESDWVQKDLSFAMTGEIEKRGIKVFPARIGDCEIPANLSHKLYADFSRGYYRGLRQLFEALCPEFYEREKSIGKGQIESDTQQLKELLPSNDLEALRKWFSSNGYALAALFGNLWEVSEAIPGLAIENDTADFIVINGQSGHYELSLVMLGNTTWSGVDNDELLKESERLQGLLRWCGEHDQDVRRFLALRMASSEGAEQIAPGDPDSTYSGGYRLTIDAKLLCGRREEYGPSQNSFRHDIYWKSNHAVDIISYDRVLDAMGKVGDDW